MTYLAHIAERVLNRPLLITPDKCSVIVSVLSGRLGINDIEASRFEGGVKPDGKGGMQPFRVTPDGVAIISIVGSLVNRGAWIGASSGLVSYEGIQTQLKAVAADDQVRAVVLDIHSGGGEAVGCFETAAVVRAVAASKPVTAVVNGIAASAAYAIASAATEIVTIETGISGSIGVVLMHADYSRALANEGITPTLIFAGAHKVDGNPVEPLPDSVRADLQAEIDGFYSKFIDTVAEGRGDRMTADMARATEARTFMGEAAVDVGLADRVGSFEMVLKDLSSAGPIPGGRTTSHQRSNKPMSEKTSAPAAETETGITQATLDAAVTAARAEGVDSGTAATAEANQAAITAAVTAERERIAAIQSLAMPGADTMIAEAISSGATPEAAALTIMQSGIARKAANLTALQNDDTSAAGATPASEGEGGSVAQTPEGWKAAWEGSAALQAEYPTAAAYVAAKKYEAKKGAAK